MLQLHVENGSTVETKSGVSKKTGQPYSIPEQPAFLGLPNGERRRVMLQHEKPDDAPLAAGTYVPKASAVYVDKFGGISVSTRARHWEPVAVPVRKAG